MSGEVGFLRITFILQHDDLLETDYDVKAQCVKGVRVTCQNSLIIPPPIGISLPETLAIISPLLARRSFSPFCSYLYRVISFKILELS